VKKGGGQRVGFKGSTLSYALKKNEKEFFGSALSSVGKPE